jgi:ATP-binding cassette subfamily F protein 3
LWIVKDGTVRNYDGDMESYRNELLVERGAKGRDKGRDRDEGDAAISRTELRRAAADRRAELAPLKRAMQVAEKSVERFHSEIAKLDAALADGAIYTSDPAKAQKLALDRGLLVKRLAEAEDVWLAASEAFELAESGA